MLQDKTATLNAVAHLLSTLPVRSAVGVIAALREGIFVDQSLADDSAILGCARTMAQRVDPDASSGSSSGGGSGGGAGGGAGGSSSCERPPTASQAAATARRADYVHIRREGKSFSVAASRFAD